MNQKHRYGREGLGPKINRPNKTADRVTHGRIIVDYEDYWRCGCLRLLLHCRSPGKTVVAGILNEGIGFKTLSIPTVTSPRGSTQTLRHDPRCPLYPRKQTFAHATRMSASGQFRIR